MAIDNTTVVPKLIAARLVARYNEQRVFAQRTNRAWQAMLNGGGDTVMRNQIATGSVADYVKGTDVVYTDADVTPLGDLTLTKAKYWAVQLEDIAAVQSVSGILDASVAEHGDKLSDQVDDDVRAIFDAGATAGPAVALDHDNLSVGGNSADLIVGSDFKFQTMHRMLDAQKVPRSGRWLIMGPYGVELMQGYSLHNSVLGAPFNDALRNGQIGSYAGFTVYVHGISDSSLNQAETIATEEWFFGNDTAVAFIDQVREVEQIRMEKAFATGVRGLYTYGAKVDHATRLFKTTATITL